MFRPKLTLVASDEETLAVLREYLEQLGAELSTTTKLEEVARHAMSTDAVVLFADDYPIEHVFRAVADPALRAAVVVTARCSAFEWFRQRSGCTARVVVLARPTWGWMLLDAVRAATSEPPPES